MTQFPAIPKALDRNRKPENPTGTLTIKAVINGKLGSKMGKKALKNGNPFALAFEKKVRS